MFFQRFSIIPRHDRPEWELVQNVDITRFERVNIHSLNNVMHFGKFMGREIRDLINMDKKYIFWLIKNIPVFALANDAISYIKDNFNDDDIDNSAIIHNEQKIKWNNNPDSFDNYPSAGDTNESNLTSNSKSQNEFDNPEGK